ncbi:flagellar hook-length control protein FliK [Pontiella agarivorans]|uniref:Flagellar hook-length control protein FliK n=1 Tax=Pontiella agarivorans TaxID=3038953 RepID=A0ABU5MT84_9BACT|nr:flagellar hook-length control protein FliK [Pontiella agarivorans]MDZ8117286.1 flagellar hook-length control protein FliK [Pontiella agarivorans]
MMNVDSTVVNAAPKNPKALKKSGDEAEDASGAEFALFLAEPETAEVPGSQGLEESPVAEIPVFQGGEESAVAEGGLFQGLEKKSAKAGEVVPDPEEVFSPKREPFPDGEDPFASAVFMPITELQVLRQVGMNSQLESAVEPESAASIAALEGKSAVISDAITRAPVQQEVPVLQPSLVSEKTIRLEQLADRFDQRLLSMVQRNEKVMRITVHPATMGRLTVLCREENSKLSVEIVAQNSGVRELIAGQEGAVRRLMQEHSVELGSFDVLMDQGQSGGRNFGSSPGSGHREARGTAPASNEEEELHAHRVMHKSGAVSLIA